MLLLTKQKRHDINNRKGVLAVHKPNTFRLQIETKLDLGIELDYVYTGEDCDLKFIDLIVNQLEQKIQDKLKACCDRHPIFDWRKSIFKSRNYVSSVIKN